MVLERWSFEFILKTKLRTYVLYAPSGDEKTLWYHTFKWICEYNAFTRELSRIDASKRAGKPIGDSKSNER